MLESSDLQRYSARMAKTAKKTTKTTTRTTTRRAKRRRPGGTQPGAGRPGLFVGKRVKVGIKLTERARGLVAQAVRDLQREYGDLASESAAVEYLIRKASGAAMDFDGRAVDRETGNGRRSK